MIDLVLGDITALDVDAIVNAANASLAGGGGVDGAIHRAAGPQLLEATKPFGRCETGDAVMTPGFRLRARFVIHAVGPVWSGGDRGEDRLLRSAYERAFAIADAEPTVRTIAFPAISTGVYGFPRDRAAEIAVEVMRQYEPRFDRIVACLFDRDSLALYEGVLAR